MVNSVKSDYGMGLGRVVVDEGSRTPRVSQKVAGIDIEEYIGAIKDARKAEEKIYQDKIDKNTKVLSALTTFQTKIKTLQDSAATMANRISSTQKTINPTAFNAHTIQSMTTGSDSIVGLTAFDTASNGPFSVRVDQLATYDLKRGSIQTTAMGTALNITGSFEIGTPLGTNKTINITSDMSLSDIQLAINNVQSDTKVIADVSLVTIGSTSTYELKLKAQASGAPIILSNTSGTPLADLGISTATTNVLCGVVTATDESTALNLTGDFTFGVQSGTSATLILTGTESLSDIINQINAQTGTTGITASYDMLGYGLPSKYQLKLEAASGTIDVSDTAGAVDALGLDQPITDFNDLCSKLVVDGTSYKKRSNTISDVLTGVTLDLRSTSSTIVNAVVADDKSAFFVNLNSFVQNYNDLVQFYNDQTKAKVINGIPQGAGEGADLYGNNFVRDTILSLKASLTGGVPGSAIMSNTSGITSLRSLGLSFQPDGTIVQTSEADLTSAIDNHYDDIKQLFMNTVVMNDSDFRLKNLPTKLPANLGGNAISVTIAKDISGNLSATLGVGGSTYVAKVVATSSGFTVTGNPPGTSDIYSFQGFILDYTGTVDDGASVSTTFSVTQGRMAALDAQTIRVLDETYAEGTNNKLGSLFAEIDTLTKSSSTQQRIVDKIEKNAQQETARLQKEFMRVYEATMELENIMNMLDSFKKAG
ncbi:MAG: flagellar filament capping protein FliD [Candidatus Paracaedibacteraceae bacterium]|nr:flagellar filament capping protein FliD [Candidatus Paracaedibacteraceae bacterium]